MKLGRYQDLINNYMTPRSGNLGEMQQVIKVFNDSQGDLTAVKGDSLFPVLNMLNCRYFILGGGSNRTFAVRNPFAMGNAWFVDGVKTVGTPNEEIAALGVTNLRKTAVVDTSFAAIAGNDAVVTHDSSSTIRLTKYEPNSLDYKTSSPNGGVAVFSEVYYPGWTATIDGKPLEIGRANYILRMAYIPAGQHTIHMEYKPGSIKTTETLAYIAICLLIAGFAVSAGVTIKKQLKKNTDKQ